MAGEERGAARKPRIAFLSDARYPGGAECYLEILAAGLRTEFSFTFLLPGAPSLDPLRSRLEAGGETILAWAAPGEPGGVAAFLAALRSSAPYILHMNLPSTYDCACSWLAPLAKAAGVPRVVTTEHLAGIARSRRRGFWKRSATRAIDRVIAVSDANRQALVGDHGIPGSKITVVRNGVVPGDPVDRDSRSGARRALALAEDAFVCLSVGELTERKGQRELIEAWSMLVSEGPPPVLLLAGGGEDEALLRERAALAGAADAVRFLGRREDMGLVYAAADLFLLPSHLEGLPFVLLEAMAAGLPVVASRIGGVDEVVLDGNTGLLVPVSDPGALASAVRRFRAAPGEGRSMGARGRARVASEFTRERMLAETAAVYRSLLEGVPGR